MTFPRSHALLLCCLASPALADGSSPIAFPATLAGHAILPAETWVPAPDDAPNALQISGKFTDRTRRTEAPSGGAQLPFQGQPMQGFSGISKRDETRYTLLSDNGFGSKANSPDAMLMFHITEPDWASGTVDIERTTFFSDPNHVVPFPIQMEGSETRYLTGADFDLEGFQVIDGKIYVGDEFGPYLFVADAETGVLEAVYETYIGDTLVRSPDHFTVRAGNPDQPGHGANLKRSRGYEGFAKSTDGSMIYALLEGPIWDPERAAYERVDGQEAVRLIEFDVASQSWTGRSMLYPLAQDGNAIGDFNMIDETRGLVIERDWGQGDMAFACAKGGTDGCFDRPAQFKRVYLIDLEGVQDGGVIEKVGFIDLLNIQDPNQVSRVPLVDDVFTFPFVTIENVDRVDATHIIVGNDNNFPFSKGRDLVALDNNEFVLLHVPDLLAASASD